MFTGIIETVGRVVENRACAAGARLGVEAPRIADDVKAGDSISVNGVCLTVASLSGSAISFDVVGETLHRTNLQNLPRNAKVNVERALRAGDRISGHFVQGHVDCVGTVVKAGGSPGSVVLCVEASGNVVRDIVVKGSVAVDGVSLTVVDIAGTVFSVALVPFTLENTVLGERGAGDRVNVEADILVKAARTRIESLLAQRGVTEDLLRECGFRPPLSPPSA